MKTITPQKLHQIVENGEVVELLDVRTPVEFREVHVDYANNVPLDKLVPQTFMSNRSQERPLYLICNSGNRSLKACEKFLSSGYDTVVSVEGGTQAWAAAGLPVVRGKQALSLERQVRIAAGALVLTGVVLGFTVHPAFFGLSGFVGAGLMFAGITDTCAMGMLIARMPWNQISSEPPGSSSAASESCDVDSTAHA